MIDKFNQYFTGWPNKSATPEEYLTNCCNLKCLKYYVTIGSNYKSNATKFSKVYSFLFYTGYSCTTNIS